MSVSPDVRLRPKRQRRRKSSSLPSPPGKPAGEPVWICGFQRWRAQQEKAMERRDRITALRETARTEAAKLVRQLAGPRRMSDTVERCIDRAARRLGWSYTRAEDVWRGLARRIESFEMDQLRALSRPARGRKRDSARPAHALNRAKGAKPPGRDRAHQ